jgi:hypothetical protein
MLHLIERERAKERKRESGRGKGTREKAREREREREGESTRERERERENRIEKGEMYQVVSSPQVCSGIFPINRSNLRMVGSAGWHPPVAMHAARIRDTSRNQTFFNGSLRRIS